jgi:hypothetical protein
MRGMLAGVLLGESVAPLRECKRQPTGRVFQVTRRGGRIALRSEIMVAISTFKQTFMTGADCAQWLSGEESRHRQLMQEAGFLAAN